MIIVSQDRKTIINFNRISEIIVNEGEIVITDDVFNEYGETIGIYNTETIARMIHKQLIESIVKGEKIYMMPDETGCPFSKYDD